jgi:sn1-specific diacylglycerol lipase
VTPIELEFAGRQWGFKGEGHYAHGGMFQVANRVRYDIEKQGILEKLFNPVSDSVRHDGNPVDVENMHHTEMFVSKDQLDNTDVSHYQLKVVGHSLGAGVAAILSLLLREKYPKVTCLAYEPPGCIFSRDLAEQSCSWVSSIVCGVDAIPRLSWHNAKRFRAQFFEMLRRSKSNKPLVMSLLFRNVPASKLLYDLNEVPVEDARVDLAKMIQKLSVDSPDNILDRVPMFLPGKILHLAKTETVYHPRCMGGRERKFAPMWIEDRADFNDLTVNQWMLFDHFPNNNGRIIRKTLKEALEAEGRISFAGGGMLMDAINPKLEV